LRYNGSTGAFIDLFVPTGRGGLYSPTWMVFSPPAPPSALTATATSPTQIKLTWTDNSDDESAFAVWRKSAGGDWARIAGLPPNVTTFSDAGLMSPVGSYTYRVRATHGYFASAWSNEATAAAAPPPPAAPTNLAATVHSSTQVVLSWTDNSSN